MVTQDLDSSFFIYLDRSIAITIVKIFNVRVFKHSIEIHPTPNVCPIFL